MSLTADKTGEAVEGSAMSLTVKNKSLTLSRLPKKLNMHDSIRIAHPENAVNNLLRRRAMQFNFIRCNVFSALIIIVGMFGSVHADWVWTWRAPKPTGSTTNSGWNFSSSEYLLVGKAGTIIHTIDGGTSWQRLPAATTEDLSCVYFSDANHGWACGSNGVVLRTVNHGNSWSVIQSGAGTLNGICFHGLDTGWAVGALGMIVKSTDSGASWLTNDSRTTENLCAVLFTSGTNGYSCGTNGMITKTTNGGNIWLPIASSTSNALHDLASSGTTIFAGGANGTVVMSTDAGQTWNSTGASTGFAVNGLAAPAPGILWAVGPGGSVSASGDNGATWLDKNLPPGVDEPRPFSDDLYGCAFGSATQGVIFGKDGALYSTQNNGASWNSGVTRLTGQDLKCPAFSDTIHGFCIGDSLSLFGTTDGGATWHTAGAGIHFIQLFSDGTGIRLNDTTFEQTSDHGVTWTKSGTLQNNNLIFPLYGFISANTGYIFAAGTASYKTTNGGTTWAQTTRDYVDWPQDFSLVGDSCVWLLDQSSGNPLRSIDAGATWTTCAGSLYNPRAVFGLSASTAWFGSSNGTLYKTINGGSTLTEVNPQMGATSVVDIYFSSADTGFAVFDSGRVAMTCDAGVTWQVASIGCSANLTAVAGAGPGRTVLVGDNGVIVTGQNQTISAVRPYRREIAQNPGFMLSRTGRQLLVSMAKPGKIRLFDMAGRLLMQQTGTRLCLLLPTVPGIYIVEAVTETATFAQRLLVH